MSTLDASVSPQFESTFPSTPTKEHILTDGVGMVNGTVIFKLWIANGIKHSSLDQYTAKSSTGNFNQSTVFDSLIGYIGNPTLAIVLINFQYVLPRFTLNIKPSNSITIMG